MQFNLGKSILIMMLAAAASGAWMLFRQPPPHADLRVWVFAESHRDAYRSLLPAFERDTGQRVELDLLNMGAMNARLTSLFMSPRTAVEVPDAVEVEINFIAGYLRPPVSQVGFLPLNNYLENSGLRTIASVHAPGQEGWNAQLTSDGTIYSFVQGRWALNPRRQRPDSWMDRIVRNRFTPWTKQGQIFGLPHDVHPVALTFRADLFQEAGIDLASAGTWPELQQKCLQFQRYWISRGFRYRHAMELSRARSENLVQMLLQRHISLVDEKGRVRINDPRLTQTLVFYVQLISGPRKIGASTSGNNQLWLNELSDGNICAVLTPDWKLQYIREYGAACRGKLRMMPLPRFEPADARTCTWGGTMIGIPRTCRQPDLAWRLIERLYLSPEGMEARYREAAILPPVPEEWRRPMYHQPDPLYGGQDVVGLFAELAAEIPSSPVSAATPLALAELAYVLNQAASYMETHGMNGLSEACQGWLDDSAADIQKRMRQAAFEPLKDSASEAKE